MRKCYALYSRKMVAVSNRSIPLNICKISGSNHGFVRRNASRLVWRHLHPGLNQSGIKTVEAIHEKNFATSHQACRMP